MQLYSLVERASKEEKGGKRRRTTTATGTTTTTATTMASKAPNARSIWDAHTLVIVHGRGTHSHGLRRDLRADKSETDLAEAVNKEVRAHGSTKSHGFGGANRISGNDNVRAWCRDFVEATRRSQRVQEIKSKGDDAAAALRLLSGDILGEFERGERRGGGSGGSGTAGSGRHGPRLGRGRGGQGQGGRGRGRRGEGEVQPEGVQEEVKQRPLRRHSRPHQPHQQHEQQLKQEQQQEPPQQQRPRKRKEPESDTDKKKTTTTPTSWFSSFWQ